jgi:DNA (cytosine-5)-methyltransferase 1
MTELTHASFFSGVGGLDLGLERAGWRTVSFSEIDPYASAVLAQRWPGVPNLGSIVDVRDMELRPDDESGSGTAPHTIAAPEGGDGHRVDAVGASGPDWRSADLWTGGFPCQDLSVAGKRRGMGEGTRSGLAYAFLDLAAVHRPRFVLLENVPGLLSSNGGRDMAALLGALVELGYGVGYRSLDARYFGVPQRRRRVFILGVSPGGRVGAERAAEVLSVGSRCDRHPPAGVKAGPRAALRAVPGVDIARAVTGTSGKRHDDDTDTLIAAGAVDDARGQGRRREGTASLRGHEPDARHLGDANVVRWPGGPSPDAARDGAPHGMAGRLDDRGGVVNALDQRRDGADDNEAQAGHLIPVYVKRHRAASADDAESWDTGDVSPTINGFDVGDTRATTLVSGTLAGNPFLPLGLDSHRYRCCGNGVVSDVAEFIGLRLAEIVAADLALTA